MGEDKEKHGKPEEFDPEFKGPVKNRSCTDVICCVLIILFLLGFIAVGIWSFIVADPSSLLDPLNSEGQLCGRGKFEDKPYLLFFDLLACLRAGVTVLTSGCPTPQICVSECPKDNYVYAGHSSNDAENFCVEGADLTKSLSDLVSDNECAAYYVTSEPILGRCVPKALAEILSNGELLTAAGSILVDRTGTAVNATELESAAEVVGYLSSLQQVGTQILSDVENTWWIILICLALVGLISLLFLILLRFIAAPIIWTLIFLFIVAFGVSASYCLIRYNSMRDDESAQGDFKLTTSLGYYAGLADTWLVLGVILAIVCLLILFLTLILFKRIRIAITIIEQTSKALGHMMSVLLWPIFPFILQLMIFSYGIASFLHIYVLASGRSSNAVYSTTTEQNVTRPDGSLTNKLQTTLQDIPCDSDNTTEGELCQFLKYGSSEEYSMYVMIYQVLVFFWLVYFVSAISELVLAGSFASYYWAFKKPDDIPALPVAKAIGTTLRYHVGSAAFGSLIITILKLIQGILEYLNRKFEKNHNALGSFIVKCLQCCCWCLEKLILYINRNAYILVMVHGSNFCSSAWRAFKLLARNILRVLVLDKITDLLMMVGRLVAVVAVAIPSGFFFSGYIPYFEDYVKSLGLNYYMVPVILIIIGGYIVAREFFSVYDMGVDTIFLSFLEDLERNDGTEEKPYYMSKDLMQILGKKNVKEKKDKNGNADGAAGEDDENEYVEIAEEENKV